jgi:hypothetical protein
MMLLWMGLWRLQRWGVRAIAMRDRRPTARRMLLLLLW